MTSTGNRNDPKQGEVFLIDVYFRDRNEYKLRPVVIVSNKKAIDIDVTTAPVTSGSARGEFDVPIEYWREAGLDRPSVARTTKLLTFEKSSLRRKLGALQDPDLQRVLSQCKDQF